MTKKVKETMNDRFKTFTVLINSITRSIYRIKTEGMSHLGLKSAHVSCLYYLYQEDNLTAKQLCDVCGEDKGALSRSIDYLEKNGYIACETRTEKKYKSPLTLTEKGKKVSRYIARRIDGLLDKASEGISEEERVILYESLTKINENLQKEFEGLSKEKN